MNVEKGKRLRNKDPLKPTYEDIQLLHSAVKDTLVDHEILSKNPDKRFFLRYQSNKGSWPSVTIGAKDERNNREIMVSFNSTSQTTTFFRYFLSKDQEPLPPKENFTDFLEQDRGVFIDKCYNLKNSLEAAKKKGLNIEWEAVHKDAQVIHITHPSLS
jgi:hypothetical protein